MYLPWWPTHIFFLATQHAAKTTRRILVRRSIELCKLRKRKCFNDHGAKEHEVNKDWVRSSCRVVGSPSSLIPPPAINTFLRSNIQDRTPQLTPQPLSQSTFHKEDCNKGWRRWELMTKCWHHGACRNNQVANCRRRMHHVAAGQCYTNHRGEFRGNWPFYACVTSTQVEEAGKNKGYQNADSGIGCDYCWYIADDWQSASQRFNTRSKTCSTLKNTINDLDARIAGKINNLGRDKLHKSST